MKKMIPIATLLSATLCLWAIGSHLIVQQPENLSIVENNLEQEFPKIKHADPLMIKTMIEDNNGSTILLDVRETDEFAVSRIPGAIRISPNANPESITSVAGDLSGKTLIFYCSVGYRSSKLATAAQTLLKTQGASEIINLRGGVFAWHNAQLPLANDKTHTRFMHPYNERWAQYLKNRNLSRMKVEDGTPTGR
jgi:rhodanese-related sulfurtransferase